MNQHAKRHEFDYPYPFDETEVEREKRRVEAKQKLDEVRDAADLVSRALGDPSIRAVAEWGTDVRQRVIVELRDDFPDYERVCHEIAADRTYDRTRPLLQKPRVMSALSRAVAVINKARRTQR